eukprot:Lithocolla_globosa_v1_NODE_84_length_6699_cov_54.834938.p6 type:complete len:153 gc:universal NODE_84_length_6699_cov_54.834938:3879-3421(-)
MATAFLYLSVMVSFIFISRRFIFYLQNYKKTAKDTGINISSEISIVKRLTRAVVACFSFASILTALNCLTNIFITPTISLIFVSLSLYFCCLTYAFPVSLLLLRSEFIDLRLAKLTERPERTGKTTSVAQLVSQDQSGSNSVFGSEGVSVHI